MSEKNERRAVWAGWTQPTEPLLKHLWLMPGGDTKFWQTETSHLYPDYETSLDACVELIDKAKSLGWSQVDMSFNGCEWRVRVYLGDGRGYHEGRDDAYPSQAICAAVDKLIDHLREK